MAAGIGLGISMGWAIAKKGFSALIEGLFAILEARSTYFENANNSKLSVQELETAGLLDKASIVLTPTGYSEDVIHNVKPSATPFGDMTHILASTSATRVNENGLVDTVVTRDVPRIDYSKGKGAILSELASVNQIRYSEDFSNAIWTKAAITMTSSTKTNPKGVNQTIYNITRAPSPGDGLFASFASTPTGQGTGVSIWIKRTAGAGSTGNVWIGYGNSTSGNGNSVAVGNEWQRISYASPGTGGGMIYIDPQFGHYFDIWGAQGEKDSPVGKDGRVSSYIPTVSTSVTRARDNYLNGGDASLIGATEGVLYFEGAALADTQDGRAIALSANNSAANRVVLYFNFGSNQIKATVQGSGVSNILTHVISDTTVFNKMAVKYKSGDIALWINGTEVATSTNSFTFNAALNELAFDQGNSTQHMDGFIKQVAVFKEALSDAELTALTS